MSRCRSLQAALALLIALVATFSTLPARVAFAATTITDCSNPDAVEAQLEAGGAITFNCGAATIRFNHPIDLNVQTNIFGNGVTFTGDSTAQLVVVNSYIYMLSVTITGVGTAITVNSGNLEIGNSTISNNQTGISNPGTWVRVMITGCTFSENTNHAVALTNTFNSYIRNSVFTGNSSSSGGGAVYFSNDSAATHTLEISGSTFSNNHAPDGGAIQFDGERSNWAERYTKVTIDGSTFTGNSADNAGGAISNKVGELWITNSTFSGNTAAEGGAIDNLARTAGDGQNLVDVRNSTFSGNGAAAGSAIRSAAPLSIDRSTLANNIGSALLVTAGTAGVSASTLSGNSGGIQNNGGSITVASSTFSGNGSVGTLVNAAGTIAVNNSILEAGGGGACSGGVTSGGHNLVNDVSCAFSGQGDRNSTAPLLGPLADNGGPTHTHAPLRGSPAINAGACPGFTTDQRGNPRPLFVCDIGAVEDDSEETYIINPPAVTGAAGGPFTFFSLPPGNGFECAIDSGTFSACTSPASFPGLSEGAHVLRVRSVNQAGQADPSPASHTWIVDLTPPDTTITGHGPVTNQNPVTLTFSGTDAHGIARYECRFFRFEVGWDTWRTCTNPTIYTLDIPFFRIGTWTSEARAIDNGGNVDPTPYSYRFQVDQWGPVTSIDSAPPVQSGSSSATFTFSAFDNYENYLVPELAVETFECELDGEEFAPCTSPKEYTGLVDGPHTFTVVASDQAGNTDIEPQSHTWTITTGSPDTTILTTPFSFSKVASPVITFSGNGAGGIARFECTLDSAAFSACSSPQNLSGLADGSHTFQVRAIDSAGRVDATPATHTWTVDLTAPETTILTVPLALSSDLAATFTFSASDLNGLSGYECALDEADFAACADPAQYSSLSDGAHTFHVRAIDAAGNIDATPASYTWTIDATTPDTTLLTTPPSLSDSNAASFTFSGSDAGGVTEYACALDGAAFTACTSPLELSDLADGEHTFRVRAVDTAGNVDPTPASYTWTVDTVPPDTTIATMPPSFSNSAAPAFTFTGSDANGIASFECSLDGAAFSTCSSPMHLSGLAPGEHAFQVRASDNAGRVDPSTAYTWIVDLTPPDTTILTNPSTLSSNPAPAFSFSGSDTNGIASYACKLDNADFSPCTSPTTLTGLNDGAHTFQVRSVDRAGNLDLTPASYTWTVDATAPVSGGTLSGSKSGDWYLNTATVSLSGTDANGIASITYKLDAGSWHTYTAPFSVTGNGSYTVAYYAVDSAGNTESTRTISVTIDATAPIVTISLPTSGGTYLLGTVATVTYTCSDPSGSGIATCAGNVASGSALDTSALGRKSISVTATDRVGKTTTQTLSYTIGYPFSLLAGVRLAPQFNQATAGSSIYLKFSLGGAFGLGVLQSGYPKMQTINCQTGAPIGSAVALPTTSGLSYMGNSYYQLVWKTQPSWAGSCRQVVLAFNDGSTYRINFYLVTFSWP